MKGVILAAGEGKVKGYFVSQSRDITRPRDFLQENFLYLKKWLQREL